MLDAKELARRLTLAMDKAEPRVTSAALAAACKVTPQAVNGWRTNGRIAKRHLPKIVDLTKRPLEFFLEEDAPGADGAVYRLPIEEAEAVARLRKALPDWRRYVLGLAMLESHQAQELMLKVMRQTVPDYKVEQAYGQAPHVKEREKTRK